MRIPGSSRFFLNPGEKINLAWMARNGERVYDLEKEGFSDGDSSASLEEISAEDVRKDGRRSRSRAWKDGITGYTIASSFGSNLYSFAWAQAVQNKPLGLEMNSAWDADLEEEKKGGDDVVIGENRDDTALQMEKEEGELEEGEIDLCSESVTEEQINVSSYTMEDESKHSESEIKESEGKEEADVEDLDRRIGEILEELDMVTLEEAEASFEDVCSRLLKSFAGLKTMFVESNFPILDAPVQQAFMGIKTLNSVLCSGNLQKSKQNTDLLLRLLIHIKNQYSMLLTQEQVTEIDLMAQNLVSSDLNREKTMPNRSFGASDSGVCLLSIEPPPPLTRNRIEFSPLLDLHADYDEGSLPSPTRGNAQPLPIPKPISFGASVLSDPMACKKDEDEDATLHSYETDALKAVTSYQQKFRRSSVLPSNELPSPTPSEECNHEEDKNDEVSSFSAFGNMVALKDIGSLKSGGSSCADIITGTQSASAKMVGLSTTSQPNYVVKAKSRDPRLRVINHNTNVISNHSLCTNGLTEGQAISKKHRAVEDPVMDDLSLKRQRQSSLTVKDVALNMGTSVLETNKLLSNEYMEVGIKKPGIGPDITDSSANADINPNHNDSNEQKTSVDSAQSVLLPALLKDMGVNPTMLMELLKMEQQRLTAESQQKTSNSSVSNPEVKLPEIGKQHQSMKPQIHGQVPSLDSQDNVGRIRMKPRDPRRILHNNKVQKTRVSEHEENKMGATSCDLQYKERLIVGDSVEQAQTNTVLPRLASPANSLHLTKNIKNSNDGMPSSKSSNIPQSGPPNCSLPIPSMANKPDGRQFAMETNDSKAVNTSTSQTVTTDSSHSTNAWEDVDHLLDGYDEQQKAAIQRKEPEG
ncbi:hypothetical protein HPP92_017354 [Vanilla planifolia]|uniref:CPL3 ARM repeat domain-containing protein n=1 Tax=Vanilla planifolia TaxID=51239 RepID=A0A835UQH6_VANPL|nr:hypothetical protein HPP92_017354 [Vanilla planifolia]